MNTDPKEARRREHQVNVRRRLNQCVHCGCDLDYFGPQPGEQFLSFSLSEEWQVTNVQEAFLRAAVETPGLTETELLAVICGEYVRQHGGSPAGTVGSAAAPS